MVTGGELRTRRVVFKGRTFDVREDGVISATFRRRLNNGKSHLVHQVYSAHPVSRYRGISFGIDGLRYTVFVHKFLAMAFLSDGHDLSEDGYCVEHIDGNPANDAIDNLRWVTVADKRDRTVGRHVTVDGVTLNRSQWAKRSGINHCTVFDRLKRGWTPEAAVSTPSAGSRCACVQRLRPHPASAT